jgi:hypothetical protein
VLRATLLRIGRATKNATIIFSHGVSRLPSSPLRVVNHVDGSRQCLEFRPQRLALDNEPHDRVIVGSRQRSRDARDCRL